MNELDVRVLVGGPVDLLVGLSELLLRGQDEGVEMQGVLLVRRQIQTFFDRLLRLADLNEKVLFTDRPTGGREREERRTSLTKDKFWAK